MITRRGRGDRRRAGAVKALVERTLVGSDRDGDRGAVARLKTPMAGNRRRLYCLPSWLATFALAACAGGNQTKPELVDPIINSGPRGGGRSCRAVQREDWVSLNRRMLVVWSGRTPISARRSTHPRTGLMSSRPLVVSTSRLHVVRALRLHPHGPRHALPHRPDVPGHHAKTSRH